MKFLIVVTILSVMIAWKISTMYELQQSKFRQKEIEIALSLERCKRWNAACQSVLSKDQFSKLSLKYTGGDVNE